MKKNRIYIIFSLDTELYWGYVRYPYSRHFKILKNKIPEVIAGINSVLEVFNEFKVPATWAIVGKLFYSHFDSIIEPILDSKVPHEVAYHSYTHIPFTECNRRTAMYELKKGDEISKEFGIKFKSFVFPENKVNHTDLLKEFGYKIYRGPNIPSLNSRNPPIKRIVNFLRYKILAPIVHPTYKNGIWEIPSSMIFNEKLPFLPTLVSRVKLAINGNNSGVIHIFMHPEDVVLHPHLLFNLKNLLRTISLNQQKSLSIITLRDSVSLFSRGDTK